MVVEGEEALMDKEKDCEICLKERLEKRVMGLRKDSDLMGLET